MSLTAGSASGGRWDREYCRLAEADPVLAGLIDACGTSDPFSWHRDGPANGGRARESNFAALVLHIVGQQISVASAFAIYDRLSAALGGPPTPEAILRSTPERIRATGLSQRKIAYLLDVAGRQRSGALDLEDMHDLDDAAAVTALTAMKGVGQWTAEMFLIYQLHRHDILPAADIGVRRGVERAYRLPAMPTTDEVRLRGERWAPYRTFATELLWRSLETTTR